MGDDRFSLQSPVASLRAEIVESEKAQNEFLRWKLLAIGGIGGIFLAHRRSNGQRLHELLALLPIVCFYCDLVSTHLVLRIRVIGAYLASRTDLAEPDGYEKFVHELRADSKHNPFLLELLALYGTTVGVAMALFLLVSVGPLGSAARKEWLLASAGATAIWSLLLWCYHWRVTCKIWPPRVPK